MPVASSLALGLLACTGSDYEPPDNSLPGDLDRDTGAIDAPIDQDTSTPPADTGSPADTSPPEDTAPPEDTSPPEETGETAEPGEVIDCADLPELATSVEEIAGAKGYHDVIFDENGYIFGSDNSSIIQSDYDGDWSVFVPGMGQLEQMAWLADGDMVVASNSTGALKRVSSSGASTTLSSDVYAYGVIVGPDEMIYAANNNSVMRVDPSDGAKETLLDSSDVPGGPRVIAFSPDHDILYIGTLSGGKLYAVELDGDYDPDGSPQLLAQNLGTSYHDGLGVDVCGNIYLTVYSNSTLYRITPDGAVSTIWDPPYEHHGHGLEWGSGIDGWRDDALYVPQPYNNNAVAEIVIEVPAAGWDGGTVLNAP